MILDVTRVGDVLGTINKDFAEKYDLNPEMLVVQGGIDAHIGMLGPGVDRAGKMAMIMGHQLCTALLLRTEASAGRPLGALRRAHYPGRLAAGGGTDLSRLHCKNGTCVSLAWTKWTTPTLI